MPAGVAMTGAGAGRLVCVAEPVEGRGLVAGRALVVGVDVGLEELDSPAASPTTFSGPVVDKPTEPADGLGCAVGSGWTAEPHAWITIVTTTAETHATVRACPGRLPDLKCKGVA